MEKKGFWGAEPPAVDVVIPTYRPGMEVRELLKRLLQQTHLPKNIFLVNTEESLFDERVLEGLPGNCICQKGTVSELKAASESPAGEGQGGKTRLFLCHIPREAFDHGGTRQLALCLSRAPYVLFMTQDALPEDRRLLERLLDSVQEPNVRIAYARQLPNPSCGVIERFTREFNYPAEARIKTLEDLPKLGIKTFFCSNVCALYERAYLVERGGFFVPSIFNEDMVFAAGAIFDGAAIAYAADARVVHSHNYSALQQFHRNFDNGVSQALHPEAFAGVGSTKEGGRLVLSTVRYLIGSGQGLLVPKLFLHSAAKFLGFRLGKSYRRLPAFAIRAFTGNRPFWDAGHEAAVGKMLEGL